MSDRRLMQQMVEQGADAEYARLAPRIDKLKQAVEERETTIASLTKEVRALRLDAGLRKAGSEDLETLRTAALADANSIAELRASALTDGNSIAELRTAAIADTNSIAELRQRVEHGDNERQDWMHWAWVGQPRSKNSDDAVYEVKIATLERAVAYWERRVRGEFPACSQAEVDMDATVVFSTRHLRLDDILRLMETI